MSGPGRCPRCRTRMKVAERNELRTTYCPSCDPNIPARAAQLHDAVKEIEAQGEDGAMVLYELGILHPLPKEE